MIQRHHVEGYDKFIDFMNNLDANNQKVHVYFSGNKLPDSDISWCDDCQRAWPVIKEVLEALDNKVNFHFVYVEVGDRPTWKDPKCLFRTDPSTNLLVLPTLIRWKSPQRLEGGQCEKKELIEMLFEDED